MITMKEGSFKVEDLARGLGALARTAPREFDNILHQEALRILAEATQITPLKESTLRKSGKVDRKKKGYIIGFYTKYAAAVHEMGHGPATKGKEITWTAPGTGAKFLEKPFRKAKKDMGKRFLEHMLKFSQGVIRRNK